MLWDDATVQVSNVSATKFCLSATIYISLTRTSFKITSVYEPTASTSEDDFFTELVPHKSADGGKWLALSDFNQIRPLRCALLRPSTMMKCGNFI
jgi:hypothetical protein